MPAAPADAGPRVYLQDAQNALTAGRTGEAQEAQEALERAESRALDRATPPSLANEPDNAAIIRRITDARDALGRGDLAPARQTVADALAHPAEGDTAMQSASTRTAAVGTGEVGAGSGGAMSSQTTAQSAPQPAPGMTSTAGETALGSVPVPIHPGDDSRTYTTPGDNGFTEHSP